MSSNKENGTKNLNVPNLRFPEFSGEWDVKELQSIAPNICSGRDKISSNGKVVLYGSTGVIGTTESASYTDPLVLVARVGANAGQLQISTQPCGVTDNTLVVSAKEWNTYIYYFLQHFNLNKLVFGSGQPLITGGMLKKIKIMFGTDAERNKITHFLSLLDLRIETQKKIIEKYESLIKGLSKMLTKQGEPNKTVSDCLTCHSSTLQESSVLEKGAYPVYGATGVCGFTDNPEADSDSILIIKDGASVGTTYYASGKYSAIGTLNRLIAKDGFSIQYLHYCLKVFNFAPYKTGLAIPHIYFKDYGKANIWCPTLSEQIHIAENLAKIDAIICIEKSLLEQLNTQKRFLLQSMFI